MSLCLRIILAVAIPVAVFAGAMLFDAFVFVSQISGGMRLYYDFGIQCPACGGTRSVAALLRGDIVDSFLYNPAVIFFCLLGIAFYIEFVLKIFNVNIKIIPRSETFVLVILSLFGVFYIGRNIWAFI